MKVFEIITEGIPECANISYGLFINRQKANKKLEEIESDLRSENEGFGYDFWLVIKEREVK